MSATYPHLNDKLIDFIRAQKMFFVATAPLSAEGSVNLSPKGYDSFEVVDEKTVAYLDFGGSGIETHAHLNENGRITIMFCAFEGAANIVRIFGKFPALRRIIMSLTACTTPMIGAFSILIIFQCLCKWILHVPLHGACYSSNC